MSGAEERYVYTAEYLYPGSFFPEETYRALDRAYLDEALAKQPDEEGYFRKDGWYAVRIRTHVEKRFVAGNGEETWVRQADRTHTKSYVVGIMKHVSDIPDIDPETGRDQTILKRNIEGNSREPLKGYGVLTRCGNWQIASDFDEVLAP